MPGAVFEITIPRFELSETLTRLSEFITAI